MTIRKLVDKLQLTILTNNIVSDTKLDGCYVGDLLSWAMSRAEQDNVWITVMGNINAVAVAVLADVPCIILADNASLDQDARERAEENDIVILQSDKSSYTLAIQVYEAYMKEKEQ